MGVCANQAKALRADREVWLEEMRWPNRSFAWHVAQKIYEAGDSLLQFCPVRAEEANNWAGNVPLELCQEALHAIRNEDRSFFRHLANFLERKKGERATVKGWLRGRRTFATLIKAWKDTVANGGNRLKMPTAGTLMKDLHAAYEKETRRRIELTDFAKEVRAMGIPWKRVRNKRRMSRKQLKV